jgi:hypothetical protein
MRLLSTLGLVVVAKYTSIWEIKQQGCMISSDGDNKKMAVIFSGKNVILFFVDRNGNLCS